MRAGAGWRQRFEDVQSELRACAAISLVRDEVRAAALPVDEEYEEMLREECESAGGREGRVFAVDDTMRAVWSEVEEVRLEWRTSDHRGGSLVVPDLLRLAQTAFLEDEVVVWDPDSPPEGGRVYAARDEAERRFLLELHHLECHDAYYWTALRMCLDRPPELWCRRPTGYGAIDLRIGDDLGVYFDTMLRARGAGGWPLLLVSVEALDASARDAVLALGDQLERSLEVIENIPTAREDAVALKAQLRELSAAVAATR
jgi:hypothetical protein